MLAMFGFFHLTMEKFSRTFLAWACLLVICLCDGVLGDQLCVYKKSVYNHLFSTYDKVLATESCRWGCCNHYSSPCCTAPISLIVGCILGGLLGIAFLVMLLYCCCGGCRRSSGEEGRRTSIDSEAPPRGRGEGRSVVYHTESSRHANLEPTMSAYELPPSYEEAMRGETNEAFKPD